MPTLQRNKTSVIPNIVQETNNYKQFKVLGANRHLNASHVKNLKTSLEEYGNFTQSRPILVNERFEVIDGQHRLAALKELGLPVFFTVIPGLRVHDARLMNINQKNWTPVDYLESYAKEGRKAYVALNQLHEEYPDVTLSSLIPYALGAYPHGIFADFRRGDYPEFNVDEAHQRLDMLQELQELNEVFKRKSVSLAVLQMIRNDKYDHGRMVKKVRQLSPEILPYQGIGNNLRQLEDVYNHMLSEDRRIRFF